VRTDEKAAGIGRMHRSLAPGWEHAIWRKGKRGVSIDFHKWERMKRGGLLPARVRRQLHGPGKIAKGNKKLAPLMSASRLMRVGQGVLLAVILKDTPYRT
jgi:hypothetical protein